jgi:hypothetical protein
VLPTSPHPRTVPVAPVTSRRPNRGGTQRAVRLTIVYLVILGAMYVGFVADDQLVPGGTSSAAENGLLVFTGILALFAAAGMYFTLTPAPRSVELAEDRLTVVGRWGRRRRFPPIGRLSVRVVRRYPEGWLAHEAVELVEVWGDDAPVRSYLVSAELFSGAVVSTRSR